MNKITIYREERPWGRFEKFTDNATSTVKILIVDPGEQFSLQYHHKREENWRVLSGNGTIQIGEDKLPAEPGKDYYVPKGAVHQATGGTEPLVILEIAFGHFDENDIVRLQDKYQRK